VHVAQATAVAFRRGDLLQLANAVEQPVT